MAEIRVVLTEDEVQYLVKLLEEFLGETRVEVRHTRTSEFREQVRGEENLLRTLLGKLRPLT